MVQNVSSPERPGRALLVVVVIYGCASVALPILGIRLNQTGGCADGVFDGGDTDSAGLLPLGFLNLAVLFGLTLVVGASAIVDRRGRRAALVLVAALGVAVLASVVWLGSFCQAD